MNQINDRENAAFKREGKKQLWIIFSSLVISFLVGIYVPEFLHIVPTILQQIFLVVLTSIVFILADLLWLATNTAATLDLRLKLWELEDKADQHLNSIRTFYGTIVKRGYGETDLFVHHLLTQMERLAETANDAAKKNEIRVEDLHLSRAELVASAFSGDERTLRYTWKVNYSDRLFDDLHWRKYFELTLALVDSGDIFEIRTLLVVESKEHIQLRRIQKLLEFFSRRSSLNIKMVLKSEYEILAGDNRIPESCLDFGIYGSRLLYQAEKYAPKSIGIWSKDEVAIKRFTTFFDSLWEANSIVVAGPAKISGAGVMDLQELLVADSEMPIEEPAQ
jgi:hypothetical protein